MRTFLSIVLIALGSMSSAQSVEERLSSCIERSLDIITYAKAWKESIEAIGETAKAYEFADMLTAVSESAAVSGVLIDMLEAKEEHEVILETVRNVTKPVYLESRLIEEMFEEAFTDRANFDAMAEYISQCQSDFGGETYSLQDQIDQLRSEIRDMILDKERLIQDYEKQLSAISGPLVKRADTLCLWMDTYKHMDVLQKKVFYEGKYYDLCNK